MSTPGKPRHDGPDDHGGRAADIVEQQLRASLRRHAYDAPDGGLVTERILHAVDRASARARSRQRTGWGVFVAAAVVLLVIGGVTIAVTTIGGSKRVPAAATAGRTAVTSPVRTAGPPAPAVIGPEPTAASVPAVSTPATQLHDVRIADLTFSGTDSGWALASADCVRGGGRCTALLHTSDGRTWQSRPGAEFNVPGVNGCADPCVSHIRFADSEVGYAYGEAFFMTTDGGLHWRRQGTGGAVALESLDGNVVRVASSGTGCPGPCGIQVQTAAIGATTWTTRSIGRAADAATYEVDLARGGSDVYLLFTGHVAGGAQSATSTLYRSADDGVSWHQDGEVCPQNGGSSGEVDSVAIAAAPGGRAAALCRPRAGGAGSVVVSSDHGQSFSPSGGSVPQAAGALLAGDPATVLVAAGSGLARSVDGGATWTASPQVSGTVDFVGFESPTVGRALADGGRTIWTTRDAGRTWTRTALG